MLKLSSATIAPSRGFCLFLAGLVLTIFALAIFMGLRNAEQGLAHLSQFSLALLLFLVCVSVIDGVWVLKQSRIEIERRVLGSVAVDRWIDVHLRVHHHFSRPNRVEIFDAINASVDAEGLPLDVALQPERSSTVSYRMKVRRRGPLNLGLLSVRALSPLNIWKLQYVSGRESHIKVFPDFSAITAITILATDNHVSQIGIKRKPRRGEGLEFHQLRDYRNGDSLRKIDWKATSRRSKLISKEYQDERDQQIVLLIDNGRRMRSQDDSLSHFDHALNATLLVSYIALRQGDSVSVMSFGEDDRWVAPQKGIGSMKTILHGLYDLQATQAMPDYVSAAEKLSTLQRKRSLVVFVTNSRDEEVEEMLAATKLLSRHHVVLLANIRETAMDKVEYVEIDDLDSALMYCGAESYRRRRQEVQQRIARQGVFAIDCDAKHLPTQVANAYLEIKSAGVL